MAAIAARGDRRRRRVEQTAAWPDFCGSRWVIHSLWAAQDAVPLQIPMSIYKPAFERAVSDNDVTHTVTPSRKLPSLPKVDNAVEPELVGLRKAKPIDHLLPMCMKWLESLPEQVRPIALANQYPRITNLLALNWSEPALCRRYLDDLLIDHLRGDRQGFSLDVHRELETLRDYYHCQHPDVG